MNYYLIDLENVYGRGLYGADLLGSGDCIIIFYSSVTNTVDQTARSAVLGSPAGLCLTSVNVHTKNAMDFAIAVKAGELLGREDTGHIIIISGDKGYQAVLEAGNRKRPGKVMQFPSVLEAWYLQRAAAPDKTMISVKALLKEKNNGGEKVKMTSAYASKLLKQLDEEKSYLLSMEKSGNSYVAPSREEGPKPDYNYEETEKRLGEINGQIVKIKHAVNLSNVTSEIAVGDKTMTVDEILVRMAQLNKRKSSLDAMRKMRDGEREGRGLFDSDKSVPEYRYLNFPIENVREDYSRISREVMQMQLALDRHNQIDEFEVDIDPGTL